MKEFNVPFVANIPIEAEEAITKRVDSDTAYVNTRIKRIAKRYMNPSSPLRIVADYLWDYFKTNFDKPISIKQIAKDTKITKNSIAGILSELSTWEQNGYPLTFIPARDKNRKKITGHIQLSTRNIEDTEKWLISRKRSIAWADKRVTATEGSIAGKYVTKKKRKIEVTQEDKQ